WLWLQYAADILFQATPPGILDADGVGLYSEHWGRWIERRFAADGVGSELHRKAVITRAPELDAAHAIDADAGRRRLGLPAGRHARRPRPPPSPCRFRFTRTCPRRGSATCTGPPPGSSRARAPSSRGAGSTGRTWPGAGTTGASSRRRAPSVIGTAPCS